MRSTPPSVAALAGQLAGQGWITDLWVAGSLATGDYIVGVSDLDLVAVVDGPVNEQRIAVLAGVHRDLDLQVAAETNLGCVYVDAGSLSDLTALHPTWTHGGLVHRILSGVTRAELVRHGFAVLGRPPSSVIPPMPDEQVRDAGRDELLGYWAWASRRPWMWLNPVIADLGLTLMARARYTLQTGDC